MPASSLPASAPPPNSPPPAAWNPPPGWTPPGAPRPMAWGMLSFLAKTIGFALLFVGALVLVIVATAPGNCYGTSPPANCIENYLSGAYTGVVIAKILFVLGLAGIGAGAGLKLHFGGSWPASGRAEEVSLLVAERRFNGLLFAVVVVLMFLLVASNAGIVPGR